MVLAAGSTETEEGIRAAGGVPALLELLRAEQAERGTPSETGLDTAGEPDLELLEPAVIALSNLAASNESNKREIASAGGIPVLVQLLAMQVCFKLSPLQIYIRSTWSDIWLTQCHQEDTLAMVVLVRQSRSHLQLTIGMLFATVPHGHALGSHG